MKLITILLLTYMLAGCSTSPLSVLPDLGAKYGAKEIECHYKRDTVKYSLDCTIHDEGEVK